jgi:hypothetical protein
VELTEAFERGFGKLTAEELAEMTRQHGEVTVQVLAPRVVIG